MKNNMYYIFFHISGIALLEVCFFFYYIGPMETKHFRNVVKKLVDEPLFMIENSIPEQRLLSIQDEQFNQNNYNSLISNMTLPITYEYISKSILLYTNQTIDQNMEELKENRDSAIKRREKKNEELFVETIEYWLTFTFLTFLLYMLHSKYIELIRLNEVHNSIVTVRSHDYDIEMPEYTRYRKNSEIQETLEEPSSNKCYETTKKIGHYFLFALCIISFQYFFFETIVLSYDPLSIDEVKYLIYSKLLPSA